MLDELRQKNVYIVRLQIYTVFHPSTMTLRNITFFFLENILPIKPQKAISYIEHVLISEMWIWKKNVYLRANEILYVKHRAETERLDTKVLMVLSVGSQIIRVFFLILIFQIFCNDFVLGSQNKLYLKNRYCWLNSTSDGGRVSSCSS